MPLFPFFCRPITSVAAPAVMELPSRTIIKDEPQVQSGMTFFPRLDSDLPSPQVPCPPAAVLLNSHRRTAQPAPPALAQGTNKTAQATRVYQDASRNRAARSLRNIDAKAGTSSNTRPHPRRHPLAFLGPLVRPFINSPPPSPEPASSPSPTLPKRWPPQRYPAHPQPLSSHPSRFVSSLPTTCIARPIFINHLPPGYGIPPQLVLSTAPSLFRNTFPSGACPISNPIPIPDPRGRGRARSPERGGFNSAISAIVASIAAANASQRSLDSVHTPTLHIPDPDQEDLRDLHERYVALKERLGRPIPPSPRSKDSPFTRSSLAVIIYLWGKQRGVRLGFGMVSRDVLAGEGYRATVTLVIGEKENDDDDHDHDDGEVVAEPEAVVWILDETAGMAGGFDDAHCVYTHQARFCGLRPAGFSELAGVRAISPTSELKLLWQVPGTAGR